jgi:uncharacterized membrane protein
VLHMHSEKRTAVFTYLVVLLLCIAWLGGAVLVPILEAARAAQVAAEPGNSGGPGWWIAPLLLRAAYHMVCHQIPERSVWLDGRPMAVCARCFGIYFGYLLGLIVYPFSGRLARVDNPRRIGLILALVPLGVDFIGGYTGLFHNSATSRVITGMIAGGAGVPYTMPGLVSTADTLLGSTGALGRIRHSRLFSHGSLAISGGPTGE